MNQTDREAIQLPCGNIEYTESFKYLGVELTSDLTDTVRKGETLSANCLKTSVGIGSAAQLLLGK